MNEDIVTVYYRKYFYIVKKTTGVSSRTEIYYTYEQKKKNRKLLTIHTISQKHSFIFRNSPTSDYYRKNFYIVKKTGVSSCTKFYYSCEAKKNMMMITASTTYNIPKKFLYLQKPQKSYFFSKFKEKFISVFFMS